MDRDEFERRVWSTFNPMREWTVEELLIALVENDMSKIAKWRVQLSKARKRLEERMARFDKNVGDTDCPQDPSILEVSDEEIQKELSKK